MAAGTVRTRSESTPLPFLTPFAVSNARRIAEERSGEAGVTGGDTAVVVSLLSLSPSNFVGDGEGLVEDLERSGRLSKYIDEEISEFDAVAEEEEEAEEDRVEEHEL